MPIPILNSSVSGSVNNIFFIGKNNIICLKDKKKNINNLYAHGSSLMGR